MTCEWLTIQEVADALKVTKPAVHLWIRKGKLAYSLTPGGERRVCKADLVRPGRRGPPSYTGPYRQPPGPITEETDGVH